MIELKFYNIYFHGKCSCFFADLFLYEVRKYKYIIQSTNMAYINHSLHFNQKYSGKQWRALKRVKMVDLS